MCNHFVRQKCIFFSCHHYHPLIHFLLCSRRCEALCKANCDSPRKPAPAQLLLVLLGGKLGSGPAWKDRRASDRCQALGTIGVAFTPPSLVLPLPELSHHCPSPKHRKTQVASGCPPSHTDSLRPSPAPQFQCCLESTQARENQGERGCGRCCFHQN